MKNEDKQLLLQDLSARLPYGVKIYFGGIPKQLTSITIKTGYIEILIEGEYGKAAYCDFVSTYNNTEYLQEEITEKCKPYLRPMSSMTEEEKVEYGDRCYFALNCIYKNQQYYLNQLFDWLNEHHFDYRGLIEKGLAIEVTEEDNPYKD